MSGQYGKIGNYTGYKKNNKEREALDYYATPPEEITNILKTINIDFSNSIILEPCAGGGHMLQGINDYFNFCKTMLKNIIATDVKNRNADNRFNIETGDDFDFLSDNYPYINNIDYIIMNPPYSIIEPFTMKALEIAKKECYH